MFYPTYIQTYVERDVRLVKNIGDLSLFSRFIRLCAGRIGSLLNMSSLATEIGVTHKKQPKLYFYDTGLVCSLLGIESKKQLETFYLRGGIFENVILAGILVTGEQLN